MTDILQDSDITKAIKFIIDNIHHCFTVLNSEDCEFNIFGYNVSILHIMIAFLIVGFFASVWWRGARN